MRLHAIVVLTAIALLAPPVYAAIKTFDLALTSDATTYHEGDDVVLTFSAKNITRQIEMLAARTHLTSTISLVVKDTDGRNLKPSGPIPKQTGPDDLVALPTQRGDTLTRSAPLSLWGYRLPLGSYSIFGTWQMEPTGELVKSTVIHIDVVPKETPQPPTQPPTAAPVGP